MKKGFTLIEILAVVIVTGLIIVMVAPATKNVINSAKIDSFKHMVHGIKRTAEMKFIDEITKGVFAKSVFFYNNGEETSNIEGEKLDYEGEKPKNGIVFINNDGEIAIAIHDGKYCAQKEFNNKDIIITKVSINKCEITLPPTPPELTKGMIPVRWNGENWVKADESNDPYTNQWYNYEEKIWANAITVISSVREKYMQAPMGTVIPLTEINTMWVWVPRYKYKIFNTEDVTVDVQLIEIEFDDKDMPKDNGSNKGEWLNHPAFTFGDEEINGFWVGKFEPTGSLEDIRIMPNEYSIQDRTIKAMYEASRDMENNETYGFRDDNDVHMMKDSEWAAVAFLSHSRYGKEGEIWINNNSTYMTGCAGNKANAEPSDNCDFQYDEPNGANASTTGNPSGIYDMSGGSYEYTMAMYRPFDATSVEDYYSGFNARTSDGSLPESKYWDRYVTENENTACGGKYCLGYALRETKNWYTDTANFLKFNFPWMRRGGRYNYATIGGIFVFDDVEGSSSWNNNNSFRIVQIKKS